MKGIFKAGYIRGIFKAYKRKGKKSSWHEWHPHVHPAKTLKSLSLPSPL